MYKNKRMAVLWKSICMLLIIKALMPNLACGRIVEKQGRRGCGKI